MRDAEIKRSVTTTQLSHNIACTVTATLMVQNWANNADGGPTVNQHRGDRVELAEISNSGFEVVSLQVAGLSVTIMNLANSLLTRHGHNTGLMLAHLLRCWTNNKPKLCLPYRVWRQA